MTSKIVVNNIEADSGINTVTFGGDISGNFVGNVNTIGVSTFSNIRVTGGTISGVTTAGITTAYINTLSGISTIDASSDIFINRSLKFASGKGIDFSADSNAAGMTSELLDDYEEGSFTPTLTGSSSNPTATYSAISTWGYYTKIGERVFVDIEVRTTAYSGGSGELRISGLPFVASSKNSNGVNWESTVQTYNITFDSAYIWTAEISGNTSYFAIRGGQSGGVGSNLQVGAWSNSNPTLIRITGSYTV